MIQRIASVLSVVLLASQLAACSGAPGGDGSETTEAADSTKAPGAGAQMNDLSILYPLATTKTQMKGYLTPASTAAGQALLPEALFDRVMGIAPAAGADDTNDGTEDTEGLVPGASPQMAYADMKVVGFRLDPCFANLGPVVDESTCQNQLRLIFQSVTLTKGTPTAVDGAVHVFYSLTRPELTAAVNEVIAAREANDSTSSDLGPLAVHPLVVKQGLGGSMSTALNAIVLKYASSANIVRMTEFLAGNLDTAWSFSGIDVVSGEATQMDIATLPRGATNESFALGFGALLSVASFTPSTTAKDDMQILVNSTAAAAATPAAQKAAFEATLRIQNPTFDSPNTMDCASCHTAEAAQVVVGQGKLGFSPIGDPNAFVADPAFVSAADMKRTTPITATSAFNLHAFSYSGESAMISQRVVNETAALVAYVNGTVLPAATATDAQ